MNTILVGVDGSAEAKAAAEFAAALAHKEGAKLVLANFYEAPVASEALVLEDLVAEIEKYGAGVLREVASRCQQPHLAVETVQKRGAAAHGLAAMAAELDADLVVVGHRGRGRIKRLLIGSVADRLVQLSPKPVLVHR